jgi:hypothetical protein
LKRPGLAGVLGDKARDQLAVLHEHLPEPVSRRIDRLVSAIECWDRGKER